jgi:hypothetical protein
VVVDELQPLKRERKSEREKVVPGIEELDKAVCPHVRGDKVGILAVQLQQANGSFFLHHARRRTAR